LVHQRSCQKPQQGQSTELRQSKPPGASFPFGDGDGADAGEGDQAEHHDADALEGGVAGFKAGVQGLLGCRAGVPVLHRIENAHLGDEDFLGRKSAQKSGIDLPVKSGHLRDGFHPVAYLSGVGMFHGRCRIRRGSFLRPGVGVQEPQDDGGPQNEGSRLPDVHEGPRPHQGAHLPQGGEAQALHVVERVPLGGLEERVFQEPGAAQGQKDAAGVNPEQYGGLQAGGKQGGDEHHVNRQATRAAHHGQDGDGDQAVVARFNPPGGQDGGNRAAEAQQEGGKAAAVQAHDFHDAAHEAGDPHHISAVFQQGDGSEEQHHVGKKGQHAAYAAHHAFPQQGLQAGPRFQHAAGPDAEHLRACLDEPDQRVADGEAQEENDVNDAQEDKGTPYPVHQDGVQPGSPPVVLRLCLPFHKLPGSNLEPANLTGKLKIPDLREGGRAVWPALSRCLFRIVSQGTAEARLLLAAHGRKPLNEQNGRRAAEDHGGQALEHI